MFRSIRGGEVQPRVLGAVGIKARQADVPVDDVGRSHPSRARANIGDDVVEDMVPARHRDANLHAIDPEDHISFDDGLVLDVVAADARPHVRPGAVVDEVLKDVIRPAATGNVDPVAVAHRFHHVMDVVFLDQVLAGMQELLVVVPLAPIKR